MYNYYANIVWGVNIVLLAAIMITCATILLMVFRKDHLWSIRRNRLINIKNNVYEMLIAGKCDSGIAGSLFTSRITPQEFIDITTNRGGGIFFNASELECFNSYFITEEHAAKLEKIIKRSRSKWRRIEAILCLGYTKAESAINILGDTLLSKNKDIAYFSMLALGQIRKPASAKMLTDLLLKEMANSYKIASILGDFPPETADELIPLTDDPRPSVRYWALAVLSKLSPIKHLKRIEILTHDKSPEVRLAACDCLGDIGQIEAIPSLRACLGDESWRVKAHAISAIEKVMGAGAVSEVIGLLSDGSWTVCGAVKDVMALHIEAALPYIDKILTGGDEMSKKYSIIALERSGYSARLLHDIVDGNPEDRELSVFRGIVKYKAHFCLEAALGSFDPVDRANAIAILAKMDKPLAERIDKKIIGQIKEA